MPVAGELDIFMRSGSIVFQHDIAAKEGESFGLIPKHYLDADVIYSDPSWKDGYDIFKARAGAGESTYKEYLMGIHRIIDKCKVPTFLTMGKRMADFMQPDFLTPTKLNENACLLGIWNHPKINFTSARNVLDYIAKRFHVILDFSCGYGLTAKYALDNGRKFVCSDINPKCVYYVASTLMGYKAISSH